MERLVGAFIAACVFGLAIVTSKHSRISMGDAFGRLFCIGGVLLIVLGLFDAVLPVPALVGAVFFWPGFVLLITGMRISRGSSRKTCLQCAERVKFNAVKCRYCGYEFVLAVPRA